MNLKQATELYKQAYKSITQKGRALLRAYLLTLVILAGLDALALILISASLFESDAFSGVLSLFKIETRNAIVLAISLFVARSVAAVCISFVLVKRITAEQVRVGQVNYRWINSMPWASRKSFSQGDSYIAIDHAPHDLFQRFLIPGVEILAEVFSVLAIVTVLAIAQPITALVAICYFALVAVVQNLILSKRIHRMAQIQAQSLTDVADLVADIQALSKLTKVTNSLSLESELESRRTKRVSASRHMTFLELLPRNLMEVTLISGVVVISVTTLIISGSDQVPGALTLFAAAAFRLLPSFNRIQSGSLMVLSSMPMAIKGLVGFKKLDELIGKETAELRTPFNIYNSEIFHQGTKIIFDNVSYSYPNSEIQVLQDVSFTFEAGNQYALVGESGSGKTTIADLMLGLIEPDSGTIQRYGGDTESDLGYVPQNTHIFSGSFAQNIALEWRDEVIDFVKIETVVKSAALENVVNGNLSQPIMENRLSGGQMQRIGIARALYRNPSLLVLDEATNSLDVNTENEVIASLQNIRGHVTTVLIAHSMRTIEKVDKVLFISKGKVIGFDTFQDLRNKSNDFNNLVQSGKLFIDED